MEELRKANRDYLDYKIDSVLQPIVFTITFISMIVALCAGVFLLIYMGIMRFDLQGSESKITTDHKHFRDLSLSGCSLDTLSKFEYPSAESVAKYASRVNLISSMVWQSFIALVITSVIAVAGYKFDVILEERVKWYNKKYIHGK